MINDFGVYLPFNEQIDYARGLNPEPFSWYQWTNGECEKWNKYKFTNSEVNKSLVISISYSCAAPAPVPQTELRAKL